MRKRITGHIRYTKAMPDPSLAPAITVLGDYAWDVLIRTNTALQTGGDTFGEVKLMPGGSAANAAVWAARCGAHTHFIGKIGRDRFGELAQDDLSAEGVRAHLIETSAHLTASVAVWIDHTGERSMVSGQGADFYLLPSELPRELLQHSTHLHLSGWSFFKDPPRTAARQAAQIVKQAGGTLSFDPASFQLIDEMGVEKFLSATADLDLDILFPNYQEGAILSQEKTPEKIAAALAERYRGALIALKLDAEGALIYNRAHKSTRTPPHKAHLIDATGAGDSFAGAFLAHYLVKKDVLAAGQYAAYVSSWVIGRLGGRPQLDQALKQWLVSSNVS